MAAPTAYGILKTQAQRELHLPSRIRADGLPECRIGLLPSGVEPRRGVDGIELRMVESVVDFPSEGQRPLLAQVEISEQ